MKRLLTLALSLGFFIWLPSAFADGDGGLSLNAPATFRQVQTTEGSPLLTLTVDNIQVREAWAVEDAKNVFTIQAGVLQVPASADATGKHVVTIYAVDEFDLLNANYANLTASAVITVEFLSADALHVAAVPRLSVIVGSGESLYTLVVTNGAEPYTYKVDGEAGYFVINEGSGTLSLGTAPVGIYTLSVAVEDAESESYHVSVTVEVRSSLSLSEVPPLTAFAGTRKIVHTVAAIGGLGEYIYNIEWPDNTFRAGSQTGFFIVGAQATIGIYTLTVAVRDGRNKTAKAVATLEVLAGLTLANVPSQYIGRGGVAHTLEASGGIAPYTYNLEDGLDSFMLEGGTLSAKPNAAEGIYTLIVAVADSRDNEATAQVIVEIAGDLALLTPPLVALARLTAAVHTFSSNGGLGEKRYTLIADESGYFSVDAESGELALAGDENMMAGQYILSLEVSDTYERITAAATVRAARNAIFVLGGRSDETAYENDVWWSVDGNSWRLVTNNAAWSGRYEHQAAGYGARLYVSGGKDNIEIKNDLLYSLDGKDWLDGGGNNLLPRTRHQMVEHQGMLYILGGKTNTNNYEDDVWAKEDGGSWQSITPSAGWTAKEGYQVVSHHGRLYKLGGANGNTRTSNVWSSADGATWSFEGGADWSGRDNHQAVSHQGRIYVLGGIDSGGRKNDVWSSADGRSWAFEGNADWSARDSFQVVSYGEMLYVLGGNDGSRANDVWSSMDGKSWNLVPGGADWSARDGLQAVVFPPPLVLLGASEKITLVTGARADLHTFSARYGFGDYTYELDYSRTDADFKININGVLSMDGNLGAGLYTVIVWVTDAEGTRAQTAVIIELFSLTLADAPKTFFASAGLPNTVSLHIFAAVYGNGAYTYNLVDESQPRTFTVGATSGVLSVLPNASVGVYTVSVEAQDGGNNRATAVATVEVSKMLSLGDAPRLSVVAGKVLSLHTFSANDGAGAQTYKLLNRQAYFTLDGVSGILSAQAASEVGVYTLSVEARDEVSRVTARATVEVKPRLVLADTSRLIAVEKKAVSLHTFTASGGIGAVTYTLTVGGNGVEYFSLNATSGILSLLAEAVAGQYTLTVGVKDERANIDEKMVAVNISTALSLAGTDRLFAAVGVADDNLHTFVASGGLGAKTYTLAAGAVYFMVGSVSGVLSVDDSAPLAIYTVSVQVTDAVGDMALGLATVEMVSLLLESALDLYAIEGRTVSLHTFEAFGGIEPNTYTIVGGKGKKYFTLGAGNGILSVQGNAPVGIYTLSVMVEDGEGNPSDALAVVVVTFSLSLTGISYDDAVPAFSNVTVSVYTFIASSGIGAKTYTLVSGAEQGFAIDAASGVLSVANAAAGFYTVTVQVSDSRGNTVQATGYVDVKDRLLLAEVPLLENFARLSVTVILHTLVVSGGEGTKRYTMIADKSGYFAVGAGNGELALPPNPAMPAGTYTLSVAAADGGSPPQRATSAVMVQLARNGIFVLGGRGDTNINDVWSSVDGASWEPVTDAADWPARNRHQAVAHNGRIYVLGGIDSKSKKDVWSSADGDTWRLEGDAAWNTRYFHQAVSHSGRLYVLGGYDAKKRYNDVWSSADGASWDPVTDAADWEARSGHQAVVHNGRIYVLGGYDGTNFYNDVWSSADGDTWIFEGNATWNTRYFHQAVSHSGRLYVLGGLDRGSYNDVWSSVNGRSWVREQANESNFWSQRQGHQSLSRDGLLYVLGGNKGNNRYNDVWSSADGVEWAKNPTEADWSLRTNHQAVVFPSPLVLVGTSETITLTAGVDAGAIHTFISQHSLGDLAYSLAPEGLGFSIDGDGVLSENNLSQTGLYVLTVRVRDQEETQAETVVNLEVLSFALADAPRLSFLAGLSTTKELHTFTPIYGVEEYTYNLTGQGGAQQHFTLDRNGVLSANANVTAGIYTLSAEVTDDNGNGNKATAAVTVEAVPQVSLADALPLSLVATKATVLHTFVAADGIGTYTYNLINERESFTVVAESGVLSSRVTTAAKTYVLMVEVRDGEGGGSQATARATVEVRPRLALADAERRLIAVEKKAVDLYIFTASGGIGAATYTLVASSNKLGYFALNTTSGALSLSAEAVAGQYTLTVRVEDERANRDEAMAAVNISAALSLADAQPIANRERKENDNLHTFVASGGIGIKTYTLVAGAKHFTVDTAGVLAVDANASVGVYTLSVRVSDADDNRASAVATVILMSLFLLDTSPLYAIVERNVSLHTFDGGNAAAVYTILVGNDDKHFTLGAQSGILSVQNTAPVGIYTLSVAADDANGNRSNAVMAVVEVRLSLLLADAPRLTAVAKYAASLHTFVAAHGGDGKIYTIEGGNADENFALNAASGVLSLRAESTEGLYTLTVQAADERESLVTAVATVEVSAVLRLADALPLLVDAGEVKSLTIFTASGGVGAKTYTLAAGNEDNYFAINATSGVLSVVSEDAMPKVYTLSIRAIDRQGNRVEARGMVSVRAVLVLNTPAAPLRALARLSVTVILHSFTTSNGRGAKRYTIVADDSGYFVFDENSGVLSLPANGTIVAGDYILSLAVSDSDVPPQQMTSAVEVRIKPNALFVLGGNDAARKNDVWSLVGGGDWRQDTAAAGWSAREGHQTVPYKGRLYVLGGNDGNRKNDVWSSFAGENWTPETAADWSARDGHQAVAHKGRIYVLGGNDGSSKNDVWWSADGSSWQEEPAAADWSARDEHQAVSHNERIYVLGGKDGDGNSLNDVWSSADGSSWVQETAAAGWSVRVGHQAVAHKGRIYVLGGEDENGNNLNDVWSSFDGENWSEETAAAGWAKRAYHMVRSYQGRLYISSGKDSGDTTLNDIWSSADGKTWQPETSADWAKRFSHEMVVFPQPLILADIIEQVVLTFDDKKPEIHTFTAQHGFGNYTYSLEPEVFGIVIGESSGVLGADSSTEVGVYETNVRVQDEDGAWAETAIKIEVIDFSLADAPRLSVLAGSATAVSVHTFAAIYGIGEYTYTLVSGAGSNNFTLAANGVLSINANVAAGVYTLSVAAEDGGNGGTLAVATVVVVPRVTLGDIPRLSVVAAKVLVLHTLTATDGLGTYTYNLLNEQESFTVVATSGVLSSRSTVAVGVYVLMVEARDGVGSQATAQATVDVKSRLAVMDAPRLVGTENRSKQLHQFATSGGIGVATYTLVAIDADYFVMGTAGDLTLLTIAVKGRYTLTVRAIDERGNSDDAVTTVDISAALLLADAPRLSAAVSVAVDLHTFAASGGVGVKTYSVQADAAYFSIIATSGVLVVNDQVPADIYSLTVKATDIDNNVVEALATVEVSHLFLANALEIYGIENTQASVYTFDGGRDAQTYTILVGNDNNYFALNAQSGVLSVQNAALGFYTLLIAADNAGGDRVQATAVVEITLAVFLADARLTAVAGVAASLHTFAAIYGIGSKTYTFAAGSGAGFTLNAASGALSLRAGTVDGFYTLTVQATDEYNNSAEAMAVVDVSVALQLAETPPLTVSVAIGGDEFVHTLVASGGIGVKTYTLAATPKYFTINATTGALSVVNAAAGFYTLAVQAIDQRGVTVEVQSTVRVKGILLVADAPTLRALARLSVAATLHTFVVSGGLGTKQHTLIDDSGYFAIAVAANSVILSLPANGAMLVGTYTLSLAVSDSDVPPQRKTAMAEVRIVKNGLVVMGGSDDNSAGLNDVWLSLDGSDWREETAAAEWSARYSHQAVAHNGRLYVMGGDAGGNTNDVWSSADGRNWTEETAADWSARSGHQAVAHHGRLYVLGGGDENDVWSSADGENWARLTVAAGWSARSEHQAVSHNSRLYMLGGLSNGSRVNDVWSSADGRNWVQETEEAGWAVRDEHQAVSHHGRLYVLGGNGNDSSVYNDVWSSADGQNWTEETAAAAWSARYGHQVQSYQGRLYLSSGQKDANTSINDIWSSADGASWQPETAASWGERFSHQMEVFPSALALFGIGQPITLNLGASAPEIHTYSAQYGGGAYTYSLVSDSNAFTLENRILKSNNNLAERTYAFTVMVADAEGSTAQNVVKIDVVDNFAVVDVPPLYAVAEVTQAVSLHTFTAVQGFAPITFMILSGNNDGRFTLDAQSGRLSVQNASVAIYTLNVEARDTIGRRTDVLVVVDVDYALSLAGVSLTVQTGITAGFYTLSTSGGGGAQTFTLAAAGNEAGYFDINVARGVLLVSNAAVGKYTLSAGVTDDSGGSSQAYFTVQVVPQMSLADAPFLSAVARLPLTVSLHTFVASEGAGKKRYTLIADESGYLSLNADSGELSLPENPAMLAGTYALQVGVSDSLPAPQLATAVATLRIVRNGIFMLSGVDTDGNEFDDVWAAADGKIWAKVANADWPVRSNHQAVVYQGRMYVLGGYDGSDLLNDMWSSADGKNWTPEANPAPAWDARIRFQAVSHNGRLYVLGGGTGSGGNTLENDVWSWAEGESWTEVTGAAAWPARRAHQAVSHNGRLYVMGGGSLNSATARDDVWSSVDGANWSFEGLAAWPDRILHQAVSHNGRIYVLGGTDGTNSRNDVWSWAEGESWRQEQANDANSWSERILFKSLSHDGLLYVIDGSGYKSDVWSSADGVSWTEVTGSADWVGRRALQAVVFPPNLELPGTSETITLTLQAGLEIYTFSAQYGGGQYTYSLLPEIEGLNIGGDGVLSADDNAQAGAYLITVRVKDGDGSHAESVINIELRSFALADAPALTAATALPATVKLHTFSPIHGVGVHTYTIASGNDAGYFSLGKNSGVLAVVNASVGMYTLSVAVEDEVGNSAEAVATVTVKEFLALADVPLLGAAAASTMSLYTFIAANLQGAATYTLVAGAAYFYVNAASGVLSVMNATVGFYTVTAQVSDGIDQAQVGGVVQVVAPVAWAGGVMLTTGKLVATTVTLHTLTPSGGFGAKRYAIVDGNQAGYFAVGESSGALLLVGDATMLTGNYTVLVGVADSLSPPQRATVMVMVRLLKNQFFVAGGRQSFNSGFTNDVWSSENGETWQRKTANANWAARANFEMVSHKGQLYILGGNHVSSDSIATAYQGVWSSVDGNRWMKVYDADWANRDSYQMVSHKGLIYVMGGSGGGGGAYNSDVWSSTDGSSWERETGNAWPGRKLFGAVSHNGRLYVMGGDSGQYRKDVWSSADGKNWVFEGDAAWPARSSSAAVVHNNRIYVLGGYAGSYFNDVWSSADGKSWRQEKGNTTNSWSKRSELTALSRDGLLYILGGGDGSAKKDVWSSADGRSWTRGADAAWPEREAYGAVVSPPPLAIMGNNNVSFVEGFSGEIYQISTQNGFGEHTYSLTADDAAFSIDNNGIFSSGLQAEGRYTVTVHVSDEEGSQANAEFILNNIPLALAAPSPLFAFARLPNTVVVHTVAATGGGVPYTYNLLSGGAGYFILDAVSGELSLPSNEEMRAGPYNLLVEVSDNVPRRATAVVQVRLASNQVYVMGGFDADNDVWSAIDDKTWKLETENGGWTADRYKQAVSHNGRLYIMGGNTKTDEVWSSLDGKSWSLEGNAGWSAREGHAAVRHNGRMYVLGGNDDGGNKNDVWSSVDGKIWTLENGNAGWTARAYHQVVFHNNRLYLLGGDDDSRKNDVWWSADGNNWSFAGNASWAGRSNFKALSHNGRMYVISGEASDGALNDVWSSVDGKSWVQENGAKFSKRYSFQAYARNGLLHLLGGFIGPNQGENDMWSSADGKNWTFGGNASWSKRGIFQAAVHPAPLFLSGTSEIIILSGGVGYAGIATVVARDGFGDYTYSLVSQAGFSLDSDGVLSEDGSNERGAYLVTVRVTDDDRAQAETVVRVDIYSLFAEQPPSLTLYADSPAKALHTFDAKEGVPPYNYILTTGLGSTYFNMNGNVLRSHNNVPMGTYNLVIIVKDAVNKQAVLNVEVVAEPALSLTDAPLSQLFVDKIGQTVTVHTFAATGGIGPKTYNIVSGNVGGHFAVGAGSGILSAMQPPVGIYALAVQVSDSGGSSVDALATVDIMLPLLAASPPLIALAGLPTAVNLHNFTGGGVGPKIYSFISSELYGFEIGANSGILSAPASLNIPAGEYVFDLLAADSASKQEVKVTVHVVDHGVFVMGGNDGASRNDVWLAGNGEAWQPETAAAGWAGRGTYQAVAHNDRLYVMGGYDGSQLNDVWSSADGVNWSPKANAGWTARSQHQAMAHKGTLYVLGGTTNDSAGLRDVWYSTNDGATWQEKAVPAWSARKLHQAVSHNGRIYVLGGDDGSGARKRDVWSSADGENWVFEGNGGWTARSGHQAVSHNGRLYVLGGHDGNRKRDVWSSDGENWRQETETAGWSARYGHQAVSREGLLYVMGGYDGSNRNDVWSSADGKSWTKVTNAAWSARQAHQAVVFPPFLSLLSIKGLPALTLNVAHPNIHTFQAQYGTPPYTYSLAPAVSGFSIGRSSGVLSADATPAVRTHVLTVWVEDANGKRAYADVEIAVK